jgi:hypothetical protein
MLRSGLLDSSSGTLRAVLAPFGTHTLDERASLFPCQCRRFADSRVSRYLKTRPVAVTKQVTNQELHRISRLCDVGDARRLVLQFREYRGATLFQGRGSTRTTYAHWRSPPSAPKVRAAAIKIVRALEASEAPVGRRRSSKPNSARRA